MPSGEVITRSVPDDVATATNRFLSAEYTTSFHELSAAEVRDVHVCPIAPICPRLRSTASIKAKDILNRRI
jgi:hypothetical protein